MIKIVDLDKVVDSYLREHDIHRFNLKDVQLAAEISTVGFNDENNLESKKLCITARICTNQDLSDEIKSRLEAELLKNNPYRCEGEEFPVYVEYCGSIIRY